MDAWLDAASARLAADAGVEAASLELGDGEADELLRVAAFAAHESGARTNAPLLCFLLGVAHGGSGRTLAELTEAVMEVDVGSA